MLNEMITVMVYVDNAEIPYKGMIMCHMIADSTAELLEMARKLFLLPSWIQYPHTPKEHFDISLAKKKMALQYGAKEITKRELSLMIRGRKQQIDLPAALDFYCVEKQVGEKQCRIQCPFCNRFS